MADPRTPRERRLDGFASQAIEGNPLTAEEKRMFEMFDRKDWSPDQRRAYIISAIKKKHIAAE